MRETANWLKADLARLRAEASPMNFELFCRRFFGYESTETIASSLGLTFKQAKDHYCRIRQKWSALRETESTHESGGSIIECARQSPILPSSAYYRVQLSLQKS